MKKINLFYLALATIPLFTACSEELTKSEEPAEGTPVTFTIGEGGVAGNLANGNISITANGGVLTVAAEAGNAEVFAANGALVEKVAVRGNANVALPAGIYVVKVTTENGVKVQKVVL